MRGTVLWQVADGCATCAGTGGQLGLVLVRDRQAGSLRDGHLGPARPSLELGLALSLARRVAWACGRRLGDERQVSRGYAGCEVQHAGCSTWPRCLARHACWAARSWPSCLLGRSRPSLVSINFLDLFVAQPTVMIFRQVQHWIGLWYSGTRSFWSLSGRILSVWEFPPTIYIH